MRQRPSNHGFTIIELLVVLATGTLLVSQIVPAADKARDDARRTVCQERLGEIARASLAYASADPGENGIPIGIGDAESTDASVAYYGYGGKSGRGTSTNPRLTDSPWSGGAKLNAYHRPLNHMLYKEPIPQSTSPPSIPPDWFPDARLKLDKYLCPADEGFPGMHHTGWSQSGLSSYNHYGTSYAANVILVGYSSSSAQRTITPYERPLSDTPNPGNTVLYWENAARFTVFAPNSITAGGEYDQSGCFWGTGLYAQAQAENMIAHGNHGQDWYFTAAMVDGSVRFGKSKGHGRYIRINDELLDNGFCLPVGNGTTCDCIIFRGLHWQLDILPARPLPSHKLATGNQTPITRDGSDTEQCVGIIGNSDTAITR